MDTLVDFNLKPYSYIHPTWLNHLKYKRLIAHLRNHSLINSYLRQALGFNRLPYVEEISGIHHFALLARQDLYHLTYILGLLSLHTVCIKLLSKHDVAQAKKALGEAQYLFIMRSGAGLNAVYPLAKQTLFKLTVFDVLDRGLQILALGFAQQEPIRKRLMLKFPIRKHKLFKMKHDFNAASKALYSIDRVINLYAAGDLPTFDIELKAYR